MGSRTANLSRYLDEQSRNFGRALVAAARRPRGETIHELRTSSRRLRAALGLVQGPHPGRVKRIRRRLRRVAAVAGAERELEVAGGDARRFHARIKGLKKSEARARRRVRRIVRKKKYLSLPAEIGSVSARLRGRRPRARVNWRRYADALGDGGPPRGRADFHRLRIALKKVRYALEAGDRRVGGLKEMQDLLGRAHDLEVLERYLRKKRVRRARARYERKALEKLPGAIAEARRSLALLR